jgi:hypothetical protein
MKPRLALLGQTKINSANRGGGLGLSHVHHHLRRLQRDWEQTGKHNGRGSLISKNSNRRKAAGKTTRRRPVPF